MSRRLAFRLPNRRCLLVVLASACAVMLLWSFLPAAHRSSAGYFAAIAVTLVAARRMGLAAGLGTGTLLLLAVLYLWPWLGGVPGNAALEAEDIHLVALGLAIVALSSYMVTPVTTDSRELRRRALFDLATDGILVWDDEGRFLEVNPAACELLQYSQQQLLGRSVCDVVAAEDRPRVIALRDRLHWGAAGTTEWRLRRQGGAFVNVEVSAKRSPDGRWNAIVRDISERVRAEADLRATAMALSEVNARLKESQQRFRLAQELAQFGSFEWDVATNVYSWSPELEALYGVEPGGLAGSWDRFAKRIHPDDVHIAVEAVNESMKKGLFDAEWRVVRSDGAVRWVASRGWMFRDDSGTPSRLIGASFDVTEQKRVEEALQKSEKELRSTADRLAEANRLKDEFLATLSHELRTPLQSMIGWSQMLMNGSLPPASREKALHAIHRNALVQAQLIGDLLDVSRIISGKLRIASEPVEFVSIIEGALDTIRPAALNKKIALHLAANPRTVALTGDADRLRQVVWNLLSNAVKFTPEGGRVDVAVTGGQTHVSLEVRDTGIGIERDFLPFVFERFSQADGSTTKPHKGLGLGLAIVRHLVHLHGGRISVESAGSGRGARFLVTLPCRHMSSGPALAALTPPSEPRLTEVRRTYVRPDALAGVRVLLVDDDAEARETLRTALETAGAWVTDADSALNALRSLREQWPDVLLSDIAMPGEDGYELIRRVNRIRREQSRSLRSIALTAFARESDRALALSVGFDAHLSKPVTVDVLIESVKEVLGREPAS